MFFYRILLEANLIRSRRIGQQQIEKNWSDKLTGARQHIERQRIYNSLALNLRRSRALGDLEQER